MARIVLKKDDLLPNVRATLTDNEGNAVDLTLATSVRFIMKSPSSDTAKVDAVGTIVTPGSGVVQYTWSGTDTNTSGTYNAEFEVNWGSGVYQTFPANGYLEVEIINDLGGGV
jgi:hypothetical protein